MICSFTNSTKFIFSIICAIFFTVTVIPCSAFCSQLEKPEAVGTMRDHVSDLVDAFEAIFKEISASEDINSGVYTFFELLTEEINDRYEMNLTPDDFYVLIRQSIK